MVSEDERGVDAALDTESVQEQHASDYRRLASRLTRLLVMLLFDVGQIKAHTTNMLSMQKGMSEELFKDILQDADRRTKSSLSRLNPELTDFVDAIETWLMGEEEDQTRSGGETNGHRGRGGARA